MNLFLITVAAFGIVIFLMAVGVIFSNIRIKGSCGGEEGCELCFFKVAGKCRKKEEEDKTRLSDAPQD
tara:strand:- start:4965 stop:5168 length:204 start_codon:yes stop_codon:yes gene_type:complete